MRKLAATGFVALLVLAVSCEKGSREPSEIPGDSQSPSETEPTVSSIDDLGSLGSAARPLLRAQPFTETVVEIAFVSGRSPSDTAVQHAISILREVTAKPVSVSIHEIGAGDGQYSADEIRSLSKQRRTSSSSPKAAIWIAYLDGAADDDQALGMAVAATVAAVFPDQIGSLSSLLTPGGVEKAVLMHEIGHLLALVNIGYTSAIDHEDPDHLNHSRNRGSVMYWAVETLSVKDIFRGGPPADFDSVDREDLRVLAQD